MGGDELFAGYSDFRDIPRMVGLVQHLPARAIGKSVRKVVAPLLGRVASTKYASLMEYGGDFAGAYLLRRAVFLPWEVKRMMTDEDDAGAHETAIMRELLGGTMRRSSAAVKVSALEAVWYMRNQLLRDADWASMSHSVEVRVPFVDWKLWREVASLGLIAPGEGKRALSATTREPLPSTVTARRKTGFTVPVRSWMLEGDGAQHAGRGLRGWAKFVYARAQSGGATVSAGGAPASALSDLGAQPRASHAAV